MKNFSSLVLFAVCGLASAAFASELAAEKRAISLFNVVQFSNEACQSTSTLTGGNRRNGTCFTKDECSEKGGAAAGNCASGFGVCCVFVLSTSGTTINQNCSYIQNPGYPTATTDATGLMYTIRKCDDNVCKFRLDFEAFTVNGPAASELTGGVCDTDSLTITTSNNANNALPVICGQNTGQHMYIDVGRDASATASLAFAFNGGTSRSFDIKVSQIRCGTNYNAPDGCFQYYTGATGTIQSFNYAAADGHLANHQYSACIRQEEGYCCIEYCACNDADAFQVSLDGAMMPDLSAKDNACATNDYIEIESSSADCNIGLQGIQGEVTNRYCGGRFATTTGIAATGSTVCDCTAPFIVGVNFNGFADAAGADTDPTVVNTMPSRGFCLNYRQISC